jgi:hypothetical protein
MVEALILLLIQYAADVSLLLTVAMLTTLVVTAYVRGLDIEFADDPATGPRFPISRRPLGAIHWADPDAPGRTRPRAPGRPNITAGTVA